MSSNIFEVAVDLLYFVFSTLSRLQYNDTSNAKTFKQFNNSSLMRRFIMDIHQKYCNVYYVGKEGREEGLNGFILLDFEFIEIYLMFSAQKRKEDKHYSPC